MEKENNLFIEIITPQSKVFEDKAKSISLPGSLSPFQVLPKHAPIVSALDKGKIKILTMKDETIFFEIGSGFVEVKDNHVSVLVESAVTGNR